MMALYVEPLAVEANSLLQGLAVLYRLARGGQDEAQPWAGNTRRQHVAAADRHTALR
jgi:hypothetical protein